jgi:hypothetical protein
MRYYITAPWQTPPFSPTDKTHDMIAMINSNEAEQNNLTGYPRGIQRMSWRLVQLSD